MNRENLKASQVQEEDIVTQLQRAGFATAQRQPASGANPLRPNDVLARGAELMLECKLTHRVTLGLDHRWIERVCEKAQQFACRGALALRFLRKWPEKPLDYVVVPLPFFLHLLQCEDQVNSDYVV